MSEFKKVADKPWTLEFLTPPNCSISSMEWAARELGPSFVYDLTVHPRAVISARNLCRQLACTVADNPFAPYVNLIMDESVGRDGWMLSANGVSVGSPGVV